MNEADRETATLHRAIWERFGRQPDVSPWRGRLQLPAGVSAMLGFVVPVEGDDIVFALGEALARLEGSGCLLPFPPDYWHITVVPPALLTEGPPGAAAESPPLLPASFAGEALDAASAAVAACGDFQVSVRGINAFRDVLVAVPYDGGRSLEIARVLRSALPQLPQRYHTGHDPLPHISLARYARDEGLESLIRLVEAERVTEFGAFHVDRLEMFVLPVHNGVPGAIQKRRIPLGRTP